MINEDFKKYVQYPVSVPKIIWVNIPSEYRDKYYWFYNPLQEFFTTYITDFEEVVVLCGIVKETYKKCLEV